MTDSNTSTNGLLELTAEHISRKFYALDYSVFGGLMLVSVLIGVYFAFFAKQKQNTTEEYLMGGKNMGIFPITMSLLSSYISAVSLLGVPAEIYTFGTQYIAVIIPDVLICVVSAYMFMPVFYKLQLISSFEYLLLRYDNSVRLLLSVLYTIATILYTSLIIYIPSLAFSQVTGINLHIISPTMCAICIFYTSLGGFKAVVWTDTLQSISMILGVLMVAIIGTIDAGGISVVLQRAADTDRLEFFNLDSNPLVRHTFWTVSVGNFFLWMSHFVANQAIVQRCLSLPTLKKAKWALISLSIGTAGFASFGTYTGLVVYAKYYDCDPVTTKVIRKVDQILPFTVMEVSKAVPGLPGLFTAGIFSAALSTMSSSLNSLSGVILQDFVKPCLGTKKLSENTASTIMKIIVVLIGSLCVGLVFLVDKLGSIIQVSRTITGITAGAMLGIYVLGMTVPWLNAKGALYGGISSLIVATIVAVGSQRAIAQGTLRFAKKHMSISGCTYSHAYDNSTTLNEGAIEDAHWVFRISYLYLAVIGFVVMVVVSGIVTWVTGPNDIRKIDRNLLSPMIHRFLPEPEIEMEEVKRKFSETDNDPAKKTLLNGNGKVPEDKE